MQVKKNESVTSDHTWADPDKFRPEQEGLRRSIGFCYDEFKLAATFLGTVAKAHRQNENSSAPVKSTEAEPVSLG